MNSVSPVLTATEKPDEQMYADKDPKHPLFLLTRVGFDDGCVGTLVRLRFTPEDRELIAKGADLLIGQSNGRLMPPVPISAKLAMPGEYPKEDRTYTATELNDTLMDMKEDEGIDMSFSLPGEVEDDE